MLSILQSLHYCTRWQLWLGAGPSNRVTILKQTPIYIHALWLSWLDFVPLGQPLHRQQLTTGLISTTWNFREKCFQWPDVSENRQQWITNYYFQEPELAYFGSFQVKVPLPLPSKKHTALISFNGHSILVTTQTILPPKHINNTTSCRMSS